MKKLFSFIAVAAIACMSLVSCNKEVALEDAAEALETIAPEVEFNFTFGENSFYSKGGDTKAIKGKWVDGDVVFLFFNNMTTAYMKLINRNGSENDWMIFYGGTNPQDLYDLIRTEPSAKVNAVHIPYADSNVKATYAEGKWTINSDDVYFTTAFDVMTIKESVEKPGTFVFTANLPLQMYPGYVQIYIEKDARFPEAAQYHCNMLNRYDKVELVMDPTTSEATYTPVAAKDNEHFNVRPLLAETPDGLVFYGILKPAAQRPAQTVFKVDGGFNKDQAGMDTTPITDPVMFLYCCKQLNVAKAYALLYQNETLQWGRWARMIWGQYQIGPDKYVRFSPGNLQASQGQQLYPHWMFAEAQNVTLGLENQDIYDEYGTATHYYDLFQWGATGCNSSSSTITYNTSSSMPDGVQLIALTPGAHGQQDATGYRVDLFTPNDCCFKYSTGAKAMDQHRGYEVPTEGDDWGSNYIEYNFANVFRTLTASQWAYLVNTHKYVMGTTQIDGIYGWVIGLGGTIASSYTAATWRQAELQYSFVFFPFAGRRDSIGWPKMVEGKYPYSNIMLDSENENNRMEGWRYWTATVRESASPAGTFAVVSEYRNGTVTTNVAHPHQGRPVRVVYDMKFVGGE